MGGVVSKAPSRSGSCNHFNRQFYKLIIEFNGLFCRGILSRGILFSGSFVAESNLWGIQLIQAKVKVYAPIIKNNYSIVVQSKYGAKIRYFIFNEKIGFN